MCVSGGKKNFFAANFFTLIKANLYRLIGNYKPLSQHHQLEH